MAERINAIAVFARTAPEQKVCIIKALKTDGHVAAMTGDGEIADIGIAMGISGTDVAKEAASMVLTDDNFSIIVKAVKEGRGIYDNMVKFVRFQSSTNIGATLCRRSSIVRYAGAVYRRAIAVDQHHHERPVGDVAGSRSGPQR